MSATFRKILVAIDGSEGAARALEAALALGKAFSAPVTVLEVLEDEGPLPTVDERPPEGETRDHWLAETRFAPIKPLLDGTEVPWERRVVRGVPADEICRIADDEDYDLVVLGSRGMSKVARWLIGSVSDRVIHHATRNVMIVK